MQEIGVGLRVPAIFANLGTKGAVVVSVNHNQHTEIRSFGRDAPSYLSVSG